MPSSKPQVVTTQQNQEPWSGQQPFLKFGMEEAQRLYQQDKPNYFPNSTVVPFSNQTQTGLNQIEQRAMAGSPLNQQSKDLTQSTLRGDFLSAGNPYFGAMANSVYDAIRPKMDAQFASGNNYGTPQHQYSLASAVSQQLAPLAFQNYSQERGAMQNAAQFAPALAETDYGDASKLLQVGAQREGLAGAELQDQINRFNFDQNKDWEKLSRFAPMVMGGSFGGSGTAQQPIYGNALAQNVGLGLGALGTYGMLFGKNGAFPGGSGFFGS
jgi:hypothetical protein